MSSAAATRWCSVRRRAAARPYSYFSPRPHGRGRLRYVPPASADVVGRYLHRRGEIDAALAEISAINAELLARRELN